MEPKKKINLVYESEKTKKKTTLIEEPEEGIILKDLTKTQLNESKATGLSEEQKKIIKNRLKEQS